MFILLVLQLALVIWVFVNQTEFLDTMSNIVDEAWAKNNEANGYPMYPLQISVSFTSNSVLYTILIISNFYYVFHT